MAQATTTKPPQQPQRQALVPLDEKSALALIGTAHEKFLQITQENPENLRLRWEREASFAHQIILKSDQLRKALPSSVIATIGNIAAVGLTLNPIKQHCTIVPRWNMDDSMYNAAFMAMYRGLVYLATQAGVTDVNSEVVYKSDEFDISHSHDGDTFHHRVDVRVPRNTADNPFVGAYCVATMPGSRRPKVEWVPAEDILKMRAASDSAWLWKDHKKTNELNPKSGWAVWFDEYAKKGATKRASKRWEEAMLDDSRWQHFQRAVDLDNKADSNTIEGQVSRLEKPPEPKISIEQALEIEKQAQMVKIRDPNRFLGKICEAYGVKALVDIDANLMPEILERIAAARTESEKRAPAKKG